MKSAKAERSPGPEYMWAEHGASPWVIITSWCPESRNTATALLFHGSTVLEDPWRTDGPCIFFHPVLPLCFLSFNPASEAR